MKKMMLFTTVFAVCFCKNYAQQFSQVTFSGASNLASFSITTQQNVIVRISDDGKIIESGTEQQSVYNANYYAQKLLPYLGRIDYYPNESDSAFRGKVRSIGTCFFTYYPSGDYAERVGKIKSAGNVLFDYYRTYEDATVIGKIKNIGNNAIVYYISADDAAYKGKLQMVGNTIITYYSSFENAQEKGKVKNIGSFHYAWTYMDQTSPNRPSNMGLQRQLINGITYIMQ